MSRTSNGMVSLDYKGTDYRSQITLGNSALCQASYMQSVTPHFCLGGEVFWAGQHRNSGIGYAARFNTEKMVSLASGLMYNHMSRNVIASVDYDYALIQIDHKKTDYKFGCGMIPGE